MIRARLFATLTCVALLPLFNASRAMAEGEGLAVSSAQVDFGLKALDAKTGELGDMVWVSDFVGPEAKQPKKVLVLNFFATWCKPCLAELPVLAKLQAAHGARGLQVVSVNFRNEDESAEEAMKATRELMVKLGVTFPVLFDRFTNRNQLAYMGAKAVLPCNVLIGGDGKVIARVQGQAATEAALYAAVTKALGVAVPEAAVGAGATAGVATGADGAQAREGASNVKSAPAAKSAGNEGVKP